MVDLPCRIAGLPHGEGPRHVGTVVRILCAHIDNHQVAYLQGAITRRCVGECRSCAGRDNYVERDTLCALTAHLPFGLQRQFLFSDPGSDQGQQMRIGMVRDVNSLANSFHLTGLFDQAQSLD